jgi:hypothetical protein
MKNYYFVSNHRCQYGHPGNIQSLEKLGQVIVLDEADAARYLRGGCALLTEEQWQSVGITADEQKIYTVAGKRLNAPAEFTAKMQRAWTLAGENISAAKAKAK